MPSGPLSDDLATTLIGRALALPENDREIYLRAACGGNQPLFDQTWSYVWDESMQRYLAGHGNSPASSTAAFRPGQVIINRFLIVREVAQGGMGVVWEAIDRKIDGRVALKSAKAGFGAHLPPEVRNAREISHPNVCKIFEIHTALTPDDEIDFISMEFLDGSSLAERLRNGPVEEPEARIIARQICAGLAEAHRKQLIHGDLKPGNIVLTNNADGTLRAVITDFGLARRTGDADGLLRGTPAYLAPELWKGAEPSAASDLYALGMLLWELRNGKLPPSACRARAGNAWTPPLGRSTWDRVIARCLDADPDRRYASAADIAEQLGPSRMVRRIAAALTVCVLIASSGVITYRRTAAPIEQVRLALLPVDGTPGSVPQGFARSLESELSKLQSSAKTRVQLLAQGDVSRHGVHTPEQARALLNASHALRVSFEKNGGRISVRQTLTDVRSGVDVRQGTGEYLSNEIAYAPAAVAGLVTDALHLPPPDAGATVNTAALPDYQAGLTALAREKTLGVALSRLGKAVASDHTSAIALAALAEAQWLEQTVTNNPAWYVRAADSLRRAQLRNPDLPLVHRAAGLLQSREGRYEQAIGEYLRALELDGSSAETYRELGETYARNEQQEEALAAFRRALDLDPAQYRTYLGLGDFAAQGARYKEAIGHFQHALAIAPGEPLATHHLAEALMEDGQFSAAERQLRKFLETEKAPSAIHTLGVILMYQSRDREAIQMFLRAIALGPERPEWWMNLGTSYRRSGEIGRAHRAFQRALDLAESKLIRNPRDALLRSFLSYLCVQLGERQRAQAEIAQALQGAPRDQDVCWMAAIIYEALKQRNDTLTVLAHRPRAVLADLSRWPDVADLSKDSRFIELMAVAGN